MVYTEKINDNMIINSDHVYHHLLSRINVLVCVSEQSKGNNSYSKESQKKIHIC